jgi:hypothetical protein
VRARKSHCVFSSHPQPGVPSPAHCECLWDYLQLNEHLWTGLVVHAETPPGINCHSWRTFWALLVNASFQCCNSERKCLWTHVCMNLFSCFGTWRPSQKFVNTFQIHAVICAARRESAQKCWRKKMNEGKTVSIQVIALHFSTMTVCWTGNETRKANRLFVKRN